MSRKYNFYLKTSSRPIVITDEDYDDSIDDVKIKLAECMKANSMICFRTKKDSLLLRSIDVSAVMIENDPDDIVEDSPGLSEDLKAFVDIANENSGKFEDKDSITGIEDDNEDYSFDVVEDEDGEDNDGIDISGNNVDNRGTDGTNS